MRLHIHGAQKRKRPEYVKRVLDVDVLPIWTGRDARTIKPREVVELLDGIVHRGSRVMANRVAGLLSQMFRFGLHRDLVEASPVQLLYRPGGKERPKDRTLSDTEIKALLENLDAVLRAARMACAIRILLLTGQRRGEFALARWRDINFEAKTWTTPAAHSKTGIAHLLPLSPAAATEFERLKRIGNGSSHVMPTEDGDAPSDPKLITRVVARNLKSLAKHGVRAFTPHDLRRTWDLARLRLPADLKVLGGSALLQDSGAPNCAGLVKALLPARLRLSGKVLQVANGKSRPSLRHSAS
jgi:integrase